MARRRGSFMGGLDRPNEPAVLILTSLASGAKHGYALAKDIGAFAGVALGPGTLYGALTRLEARGLIEPAEGDRRRRPYRITAAGRAALARAVEEMRAIADEGAARLGLQFAPVGGVTMTVFIGVAVMWWVVAHPARRYGRARSQRAAVAASTRSTTRVVSDSGASVLVNAP